MSPGPHCVTLHYLGEPGYGIVGRKYGMGGEDIGWEEEIWGRRRNMGFCGGAGEVIVGGTLGGKK